MASKPLESQVEPLPPSFSSWSPVSSCGHCPWHPRPIALQGYFFSATQHTYGKLATLPRKAILVALLLSSVAYFDPDFDFPAPAGRGVEISGIDGTFDAGVGGGGSEGGRISLIILAGSGSRSGVGWATEAGALGAGLPNNAAVVWGRFALPVRFICDTGSEAATCWWAPASLAPVDAMATAPAGLLAAALPATEAAVAVWSSVVRSKAAAGFVKGCLIESAIATAATRFLPNWPPQHGSTRA